MITREQVEQVLGHALSEEQWLSTSAPLDSGVIVAGAGSGKTSVMAARVIWAVGSGQVTADQVLGLTFTRKAAAELLKRIRDGLARATDLGCVVVDPENPSGDPLISTSHLVLVQSLRLVSYAPLINHWVDLIGPCRCGSVTCCLSTTRWQIPA